MENKKKIILSSLGLLLLTGVLVAAVFTIGKTIVFKNKAFTETGTATLTVSPSSGTKNVGDIFPVTFGLDTAGAAIGLAQFDISFPSGLDVTDSAGNPVNELTVPPALTGSKWQFAFNSVTRTGGQVRITFNASYNDSAGFISSGPLVFATAYLKAGSAGAYPFTFDSANTVIYTKTYPVTDILKTPDPVSFTISSTTTPGVGQFLFVPSTSSISVGQTVATQVKVNTGGTAVSSLSFRLSYSSPELEALSITPDAALVSSADWAFPVKTITSSGGVVTIDFAAINSNIAGFTPTTETILATISFRANSVPATNPVVLSFDPAKTSILSKASPPVEILQMPTNLSYTVTAALECTADSGCPDTKKCVNNACVAVVCTAPPECKSYVVINHACQLQNLPDGVACGATGYTCQAGVCTAPAPSTLSFGFKVQGVTAANITKTFAVTVKGTTTSVLSQTLTSDANGVFRATNVTMPNVGTTVDIVVKGANTLKRKLGSINLIPGSNTAPTSWESVTATLGDFNNDNIFNITDIGLVLQHYTVLSTPTTTALSPYDMDNDGNFALKDIAIILGNFTDLSKPGD